MTKFAELMTILKCFNKKNGQLWIEITRFTVSDFWVKGTLNIHLGSEDDFEKSELSSIYIGVQSQLNEILMDIAVKLRKGKMKYVLIDMERYLDLSIICASSGVVHLTAVIPKGSSEYEEVKPYIIPEYEEKESFPIKK
jgi:hypothetical protein